MLRTRRRPEQPHIDIVRGTTQPKAVVSLVHGTFARGSRWTSLEEVLMRCLPRPVRVEYPRWSGRNRVEDRKEAADLLRQHLNKLVRRFPNADHYVIAHSHGGNIALAAVDDPELQRRLKAVICLSTPFLNAQLRDVGPSEISSIAAGLVLLAALAGLALANTIGLGPVIAAVAVLLLALGMLRPGALRERARTVRAAVALPDLTGLKLFIVRSPVDEALLGLISVQALQILTSKWESVSRLAFRRLGPQMDSDGDERLMTAFAVIGGCFLLGPGLLYAVSFLPDHPGNPWRLVGIVQYFSLIPSLGAAAFSIMLVVSVLVVPLVVATAFLLRPFGVRIGAAEALFLRISVEPTPPGCWPCFQLPWSEAPLRGYAHSLSYEDPRALSQIERWVAGGAA